MAIGRESERTAWNQVEILADHVYDHAHNIGVVRRTVSDLARLAQKMMQQLARGIHVNPRKQNPALALIVPNPPRRSDWSERVYAIQYQHTSDGDDYEHEFERGVCLRSNADGSVTLYRRDGRPVWEAFPG